MYHLKINNLKTGVAKTEKFFHLFPTGLTEVESNGALYGYTTRTLSLNDNWWYKGLTIRPIIISHTQARLQALARDQGPATCGVVLFLQ